MAVNKILNNLRKTLDDVNLNQAVDSQGLTRLIRDPLEATAQGRQDMAQAVSETFKKHINDLEQSGQNVPSLSQLQDTASDFYTVKLRQAGLPAKEGRFADDFAKQVVRGVDNYPVDPKLAASQSRKVISDMIDGPNGISPQNFDEFAMNGFADDFISRMKDKNPGFNGFDDFSDKQMAAVQKSMAEAMNRASGATNGTISNTFDNFVETVNTRASAEFQSTIPEGMEIAVGGARNTTTNADSLLNQGQDSLQQAARSNSDIAQRQSNADGGEVANRQTAEATQQPKPEEPQQNNGGGGSEPPRRDARNHFESEYAQQTREVLKPVTRALEKGKRFNAEETFDKIETHLRDNNLFVDMGAASENAPKEIISMIQNGRPISSADLDGLETFFSKHGLDSTDPKNQGVFRRASGFLGGMFGRNGAGNVEAALSNTSITSRSLRSVQLQADGMSATNAFMVNNRMALIAGTAIVSPMLIDTALENGANMDNIPVVEQISDVGFTATYFVGETFDTSSINPVVDAKVAYYAANPDAAINQMKEFVNPENQGDQLGKNDRDAIAIHLTDNAMPYNELLSGSVEYLLRNNASAITNYRGSQTYMEELLARSELDETSPLRLADFELQAFGEYAKQTIDNEAVNALSPRGSIEYFKMYRDDAQSVAYRSEVENKIKSGQYATPHQQEAYTTLARVASTNQKELAGLAEQKISDATRNTIASGGLPDLKSAPIRSTQQTSYASGEVKLPEFPVKLNEVFKELNTWGQGDAQNRTLVKQAWENASIDGNDTIDNAQEWNAFREKTNPQTQMVLNIFK